MKKSAIALFIVSLMIGMTFAPVAQASSKTFPGKRPFTAVIPANYKKSTPAPLIIVIHGYTSSGAKTADYLQLDAVANKKGFIYVAPNGTLDEATARFWNATDSCCNFYKSKVDDSAYLKGIIDTVSKNYSVDPKRIYVIGHSNGGFMTHVMGCRYSGQIAAIASFAGELYKVASKCAPTSPISVLQIQGTQDETINYQGGALGSNKYPGAEETISDWAKYNKCAPAKNTFGIKRDIDSSLAGSETVTSSYKNCAKGVGVELWSVVGGAHVPTLSKDFSALLIDWLYAHPKA